MTTSGESQAKTARFYYKSNKLQMLKGFCNVVEQGSFLKAAALMCISPASITLQIQALERDLDNVSLFLKKGKSVVLTDEGKQFYDMAKRALFGVDNLYDTFLNNKRQDINITAHYTLFLSILPRCITKILKDHSEITLFCKDTQREVALRELMDGKLDLCVYPMDDEMAQKYSGVLDLVKTSFEYKPALIAAKNSKIAKAHPEWIHLNESVIDMLKTTPDFISKTISSKVRENNKRLSLDIGDSMAFESFIKYGFGCTISEKRYINHWNRDGSMHTCDVIGMPESYYYIIKSQKSYNKTVNSIQNTMHDGIEMEWVQFKEKD